MKAAKCQVAARAGSCGHAHDVDMRQRLEIERIVTRLRLHTTPPKLVASHHHLTRQAPQSMTASTYVHQQWNYAMCRGFSILP
jgi:hypothetical protein